ncbi:hypothetical protein RRG08_008616 [Elysia crispata]|uniref:Sema domain-containing protein n=1 Tax=Elysia crispata TaxID=231223 RepID=A0AAE1B937_9GAST|nr:hypothetical protein RRG08_008616 [Elysia crispata]
MHGGNLSIFPKKLRVVIANEIDCGCLDPDLKLQTEAVTGPHLDHPNCRPPPVLAREGITCSHQFIWTNNYNKIMAIDYVHMHLITCGTLFQGTCEKRFLSNISSMEPRDYTTAVVNHFNDSSTVAFIAPGPAINSTQPNVLYVAQTHRKQFFADLPALITRKLSDFTIAFEDQIFYRGSHLKLDVRLHEKFRITYIYGFSSGGFSYFLARQPRNSDDPYKGNHTVLIRLCQNDERYQSYTEVPLLCRMNGTTYNMVQVAAIGTAGRELALSMNVTLRSKVLYTVFTGGPGSSGQSVFCLYSLDAINSFITESWRACFRGEGYYGGGHLNSAKKCSRNTEHPIDENYCGQVQSNNPLGISNPIVANALLSVPEDPKRAVTALGVSITHAQTVAFAGTSNGRVLKIAVSSNTSANVYETASIAPGESFRSDLAFDEDGGHLYLLTNSKCTSLVPHPTGERVLSSAPLDPVHRPSNPPPGRNGYSRSRSN